MVAAGLVNAGCGVGAEPPGSRTPSADARVETARAERREFTRLIRLHGTVEAVRSATIQAPRLTGPGAGTLVLTLLAPPGSPVRRGELIVEFDRQSQQQTARDREAEYRDLEEQIRKRLAEHRGLAATDAAQVAQATNAVERAKLEMIKNDMLPPIEAEKNRLALEEAEARLAQLRDASALKRRAAAAEIRILEIQRDRARNAMRHAEGNASRLTVASPLDGFAVAKVTWKGSQMGDVVEGEEVRAGVPVLEVVDPTAMRVRAKVNQADLHLLGIGQPVRVTLDAYEDLTFAGRVEQVGPIGLAGGHSSRVRTFLALVSIEGSDARLIPDLSAAVDVEVLRQPEAIVVPRDAVRRHESGASVDVQTGASFETREVVLGPMSDLEAVIVSGLDAGAIVRRGGR
jgi:hypothetical protein